MHNVILLSFFFLESKRISGKFMTLLLAFIMLSFCNFLFADTFLSEWTQLQNTLCKKGIEISCNFYLDTTWNLDGGKHRTRGFGNFEYLLDLIVKAKSEPLFHYSGGTFFIEYESHHGESPSRNDVGSFVPIDYIEAPPFDALYACWYKQEFGKNFWILIGKSDAFDDDRFTYVKHASLFLNNGYTALPSILFFPTYPNPAMSVVGCATFLKDVSLSFGIFDGSLANGVNTGKGGVFGHFFDHLFSHAFLISELDLSWEWCSLYPGQLGIGGWVHTAEFNTFDGKKQRGTSGPYITLDQVIYKKEEEEVGIFFLYGSANPQINPIERYFAAGLSWKNFFVKRPEDTLGFGMSRPCFSPKAGFSKSFEASYELFYVIRFCKWGYLEPDFQYIVHPGGNNLSNASVFTLRLQLNF